MFGLEKNDYIILSPLSFVAAANAVSNVGSTPVFVDIDEYANLDPFKTEKNFGIKKKKEECESHYCYRLRW